MFPIKLNTNFPCEYLKQKEVFVHQYHLHELKFNVEENLTEQATAEYPRLYVNHTFQQWETPSW